MTSDNPPLLRVKNLSVSFARGSVKAVRDVSFTIREGETMGLVGESGSGKSLTSLAVLGLLEMSRANVRGSIELNFSRQKAIEIVGAKTSTLRRLRGRKVAMIFQDPMTSLNPVVRIGDQIAEAIYLHQKIARDEIQKRTIDLLGTVGIPEPEVRARSYPHQMSGGMCQRIGIAMALACSPELLIADEPTTALDVTVQAQILETLKSLQNKFGMAMLFISHDLGVVSEVADRVAVMYAGQIVETGSVDNILATPNHPYTQGLIRSIPDIDAGSDVPIEAIPGTMPDPANLPTGCAFFPRCAKALPGICDVERAAERLLQLNAARAVRCELFQEGVTT